MHDTPRVFTGAATFVVTGLGSGDAARAVLDEISAVPGVDHAEADLEHGTITVRATGPVERADIALAVHRAGREITQGI